MTVAKSGDSVKVHYTGTLEDGTQFDSSVDVEPLEFTLGGGQVIVGFDEAITGMEPGEKKSVTIPVEKAYGQRNEEMVINAPRDQVPDDITPEIGQRLQLAGPDNQPIVVEITDVTDEHIQLDANPPLAGKNLNFDLELLEIV